MLAINQDHRCAGGLGYCCTSLG
uniref:Uncharacterized protein n=1 Tax=Anopheles albimanus TaxID=7167 RepID=A0A182FVL4_ANOAL